jgi:hypothetical protein
LEAKEAFTGRLTEEILESRTPKNIPVWKIKELDLSNSKLRDYDETFNDSIFHNLKVLCLNNNYFMTLRSFGFMP